MRKSNSPLRYPGGKSKISCFIRDLLHSNNIQGNYVEPFAGGAGVAINLLLSHEIQDIYLNDKDKSIYAFWYSILNYTDSFIDRIRNTEITVEEFNKQKQVQQNKDSATLLELGFSTFFLNRTTRSGIIKAGPIGGKNQTGKYLIDVRFNKKNLIKRIQEITKHKDHIHLYNEDAVVFLSKYVTKLDPHNTLVYLDPPYYERGRELYMNFYQKGDHVKLYQAIKKLPQLWMVSYDDQEEILSIYKNIKFKFYFDLNYSLAIKRKATELFFFKEDVKLPQTYGNSLVKIPN